MKKIPTKKIQMEKIKRINLFLVETIDLTIHPEMHPIFVSQPFQEKLFSKKYKSFFKFGTRVFHLPET